MGAIKSWGCSDNCVEPRYVGGQMPDVERDSCSSKPRLSFATGLVATGTSRVHRHTFDGAAVGSAVRHVARCASSFLR